MDFNNYISGVTQSITNQTLDYSITSETVGNALTDLAQMASNYLYTLDYSKLDKVYFDGFGSKNLLNPNLIATKQAVNYDGTLVSLDFWNNFLPTSVSGNTVYTFTTTISPNDTRVRFEDADHNLISFIKAQSVPFTFTTPANCKFVVLPSKLSDNDTAHSAQLEIGSLSTNYTPYTPIDFTKIKFNTYNTKNLIDKSAIIENVGLYIDNFRLETLQGFSYVRVPVLTNTIYTYQSDISILSVRVRFEDSNYNLISGLNGTTFPFTFKTPANCRYICLLTNDNNVKKYDSLKLEIGGIATPYVPYKYISNWQDKTITFFGDSITDLNKFQPIVSQSLGLQSYVNNGIPGSCVTHGTNYAQGDGVNRVPLIDRVQDIINIGSDLTVIFAGTNDWHYSVDHNSFAADYISMLARLQAGLGAKRIAVLTLLQRDTDRSKYVEQKLFADATKAACEQYAVPYLDLFTKAGITYENIGQFTFDNTHPNDTVGMPLLAKLITGFLNTI